MPNFVLLINPHAMETIYKSKEAKSLLMQYYDEKLASLTIDYQSQDISTPFGNTHVLTVGPEKGKPIVVFHGINAGAPLTLEAMKELSDTYRLIFIDTIGQVTKSAETVLNIKNDEYAIWANEVLEQLQISTATFIGISYGGFILQKLIQFKPDKVAKCIFVVPAGIVNGGFWPSMTKLSFPLMRFMLTKKEAHLRAFTKAFVPKGDEFMLKMQREMLLGVKIDFRRPRLLQAKDVAHFNRPVYLITADDDIFFPKREMIEQSKKIFLNMKDTFVLQACKHMPAPQHFPIIQTKIREWMEEK